MAVSPDGRRLYIGGRFTQAGGGSAPQVAALDLRTGLMDPDFKPSVSRNGSVHAIALSGERLYIGGAFKEVDGDIRYNSVAALEARTGKLIQGWVAPPFTGSFIDRQGTPTAGEGGAVNALAVIGQYLVVGGEWVHIGTDAPTADYDAHSGLAALDLSDGSRAAWRPHNDRPVFALTLFPDGSKVCAAVGGQGGGVSCLAAGQDEPVFDIKPTTPDMKPHDVLDHHIAHVDGDALGVAVTDNRIYLGGHFDVEEPDPDAKCLHTVPSQCFPPYSQTSTPHRHLVAYDHNGKLDPTWTAQADTAEGVTTILAGPDALYVGGNMKHTLDNHPGVKCWPCQKPQWGAAEATFHPGFAMFPAK
jgi:hypothetical protein